MKAKFWLQAFFTLRVLTFNDYTTTINLRENVKNLAYFFLIRFSWRSLKEHVSAAFHCKKRKKLIGRCGKNDQGPSLNYWKSVCLQLLWGKVTAKWPYTVVSVFGDTQSRHPALGFTFSCCINEGRDVLHKKNNSNDGCWTYKQLLVLFRCPCQSVSLFKPRLIFKSTFTIYRQTNRALPFYWVKDDDQTSVWVVMKVM